MKPQPIVILGPTAGGKSELAVALAEAVGGEVIGADSMQVYRHMDAGTAKPSEALRGRVPHHLIDIVEPTERFTVADWLHRADALIGQLQGAGKVPIVVGGTNLYIRALLEGLFDGPNHDAALREQLEGVPSGALHEQLAAVDPESAGRIHPNDRRKLVRALEVHRLTGKPISELQSQWREDADGPANYRHDPILVGLDWPVPEINRRINQRVKTMFYPEKIVPGTHAGPQQENTIASPPTLSLSDETQQLLKKGLMGQQAREALGYKQVIDYLKGRCTLDEAYEKTKVLTRRFAKMQRTWLKRFRGVKWHPAAERSASELAEEFLPFVTPLE